MIRRFYSSVQNISPYVVKNLVNGNWTSTKKTLNIVNPLHKDQCLVKVPNTSITELNPFLLNRCPRYGLHNPLYKPERYLMYGNISFNVGQKLDDPEIENKFIKLIQLVAPKDYNQAKGEVQVTKKFFKNFAGDNVRYLAGGFSNPGDHYNQETHGYRFPYGEVSIIAPFNFPLEIPALQLMGALYMGNKPTLHVDPKVSLVMYEFIKLLIECGMSRNDVNFLNGQGDMINSFLLKQNPYNTQFTGSAKVANKLSIDLKGKIKIEDAGFNWKIVADEPNSLHKNDIETILDRCDKDAYDNSGQKCSAQSLLFFNINWMTNETITKLAYKAKQRNLTDLSVAPTLSVNNKTIQEHIEQLLKINGSEILFGGKMLKKHNIPDCYGYFEPTAIYIPLEQILQNFEIVTKEIFAPIQVITSYDSTELVNVLDIIENLEHRLTAALVTNNIRLQNYILSRSTNGTTYVGLNARTTGAPQNHFFGPSGDPRGAGIGSKESIIMTWSTHREIIKDFG